MFVRLWLPHRQDLLMSRVIASSTILLPSTTCRSVTKTPSPTWNAEPIPAVRLEDSIAKNATAPA